MKKPSSYMEMKNSQVSRRAFATALAKVQPGEGSLPNYSVPEFRAKSYSNRRKSSRGDKI